MVPVASLYAWSQEDQVIGLFSRDGLLSPDSVEAGCSPAATDTTICYYSTNGFAKERVMAIYEHLTSLAGEPVVDWDPGKPDSNHTTYRISLSYDDEGEQWTDRFASFLDAVPTERITGLVVGAWEEMGEDGASASIVEALVVARDRLPNLRALFFGDIISEESEISWIWQTDISPLFDAYPKLEYFCVRGAAGLQLGALHHQHLKSLIIQSGGLGAAVTRAAIMADLPALEHLELWLGTDDYGGDTTVADLQPLFSGTRFPKLHYLGLRDSVIADQIAIAIAQAPVLERIRVLDLSLGTLSDEGATALLASPLVARLAKLDIHHHFCSNDIMAQFQQLGIEVDVSEQEQPDQHDGEVWRYVSVSE
jgi:hypothetical protein